MSVLRRILAAVVCLLASFLIPPSPAHADENLLGYVYGAETLPRGKWEVYQWVTMRSGKGRGSYRAFDLRTEIETGLTDRLQAAFYVNARSHEIEDVPGLDDRSAFAFQGVSAEFKYRLKSPYLDGYGFALYAEPGYNRVDKISGEIEEELELELKAIFQKNFLDDTVVWSVNYTLEPEWAIGAEEEEGADEHEEARKELIEELASGVSVRFAPRWFLGAELRVHSEWPDFSRREHLAAFLGPSLHYGGERIWWTLSVMPQVWGWPSSEVSHLHVDEHEQVELRLKFGYNFR